MPKAAIRIRRVKLWPNEPCGVGDTLPEVSVHRTEHRCRLHREGETKLGRRYDQPARRESAAAQLL